MKLKSLDQQSIVITGASSGHLSDWLCRKTMYRTQLREPKHTFDDNLHAAGQDGNVRGEWKDRTLRPGLYTHAVLQPAVFGLVASGVAAIARESLRRRSG